MSTPDRARLRESDLALGARLGGGAQGDVFRLTSAAGLAFKRYHQANVRDASLRKLLKWRSDLAPADRARLDAWAAWPLQEVTRDNGTARGFTMALVPAEFQVQLKQTHGLREMQFLLYPLKSAWSEIGYIDLQARIEIALDLSRMVAFLHGHDIVIGDLSPTNVLWTVDEPPRAFLIDTDGCRFKGSKPPADQLDTPDWNDPLLPGSATLESDRYKLALAVLRILASDPRLRPSAGPALPGGLSGARGIAQLAIRAAAHPADRPSAVEWVAALKVSAGGRGGALAAPTAEVERPRISVRPRGGQAVPRPRPRPQVVRPTINVRPKPSAS